MSASSLILFVPELFAANRERVENASDFSAYPALNRLIQRATWRAQTTCSIEHLLSAALDIESSAADAGAEFSAPADRVSSAGRRMRADPVYLRADPHQILLFDDPSIHPSAEEADALIAELNEYLPETPVFRGAQPHRWYIAYEQDSAARTFPTSAVRGRAVGEFQPSGEGGKDIALLMHEAQMVLHASDVNRDRESRSLPPINGLWLWGGLSTAPNLTRPPFSIVAGPDVLVHGIAKKFGMDIVIDSEPRATIKKLSSDGVSGVVVLGNPCGAIGAGSNTNLLDELENAWVPAVWRALRRFELTQVKLETLLGSFVISHFDSYKVWRSCSVDIGDSL